MHCTFDATTMKAAVAEVLSGRSTRDVAAAMGLK